VLVYLYQQTWKGTPMEKVKHDFYADELNGWIPDVKLVKVQGDYTDRFVWFLWRGTEQWLQMSRENEYNDLSWLVVDTKYTDDFQEFLYDELGGYDSLESMFSTGLDAVIPEVYLVEFEQD